MSTSFSSEDEREDSSMGTPIPDSPLPTRRLFDDGNTSPLFGGSGILQAFVIMALVLMSASAWLPVFYYAMGWESSSSAGTETLVEGDRDAAGVVYVFHEPGVCG